ncbi:MAG: mechanosensitive ion channel [Candidatus Omnitrophica bacterium]|nr:mechanosensitive ion channel [Candidatus Omnitrophota bacterium]
MEKLLDSLQGSLGASLPGVVGALVILVLGWIVAWVVKTVLKKTLRLCKLNDHVKSKEKSIDVENGIATGGYYFVLMMVVLAVFNQLRLEIVAGPIRQLLDKIFAFVPNLIGGGLLVLLAWLLARIGKKVCSGFLGATGIDRKVQTGSTPVSHALGEVVYWLVLVLFLPAILGVFELQGLLAPVQSMVTKITDVIPDVLAAAVIIVVGWFVAKVLRELVSNLLTAAGLNHFGEKAGFRGGMSLSAVIGLVVYFLVLIPAIVAGLNALNMSVIANPATQMLGAVMAAVPNIFAAVAIVTIVYLVAKPVTGLISQLLQGMGFDRFPRAVGFVSAPAPDVGTSPSQWAGKVAFFFMMLFATVEAANRLGFDKVSEVITSMIQFGGQVLMGSVIIAVGLWLSNIVHASMNQAAGGNHAMSGLVRVVILGLVLAMGLRAMGLANDIVNLAFGLTLGAAAVAFALAFGLGGREAAGKQMDYWLRNFRGASGKTDKV